MSFGGMRFRAPDAPVVEETSADSRSIERIVCLQVAREFPLIWMRERKSQIKHLH